MESYTRQTLGVLIAAMAAAVLLVVLAPVARGVPAGGEGVPQGEDTAISEQSREEAFKKLADAQAALARATENAGPRESRIDHDPEGNPYVAGELMVAYKEGIPSSAVTGINQRANARLDDNIPEVDSAVLSFPEVKNERARAAREAALERRRQIGRAHV